MPHRRMNTSSLTALARRLCVSARRHIRSLKNRLAPLPRVDGIGRFAANANRRSASIVPAPATRGTRRLRVLREGASIADGRLDPRRATLRGNTAGVRTMFRSIKDLEGYVVGATDGPIGHVKDFYFDDQAWVVRYLVVDAGVWLSSRKVLVSPIAIGRPDWTERLLHVSITKEQVKNSPDIDTERPVSRQHEIQYSAYYGYPYYWGGAGFWGGGMYPNLMMPGYGGYGSPHGIRSEAQNAYARAEAARNEREDSQLRSCRAVMKYHVHASDGDLGHVEGMLVDDETWAIR